MRYRPLGRGGGNKDAMLLPMDVGVVGGMGVSFQGVRNTSAGARHQPNFGEKFPSTPRFR